MTRDKKRTASSDDYTILVPLFLAVIALGLFSTSFLGA